MLKEMTEAFITNTSGEITAVEVLDKTVVGNGKPGPMTRILKEKFNDEICSFKHP
jgi:branched-subunit amino acid aminotransferase/4-amino-4-deoxychorismate lyase